MTRIKEPTTCRLAVWTYPELNAFRRTLGLEPWSLERFLRFYNRHYRGRNDPP